MAKKGEDEEGLAAWVQLAPARVDLHTVAAYQAGDVVQYMAGQGESDSVDKFG
ncbi:hypothetical protein [Streptomyces clavifer]|uniref:hypothetical protein n=1 Tax=Streptomyces clavifer TaxID=68188 RepID=UPI0036C7207F